MSLDVCIKFKERKMVNYNKTHVACGSTLEVHGDKEEFYQRTWCGDITHNMDEQRKTIKLSLDINDDDNDDVFFVIAMG